MKKFSIEELQEFKDQGLTLDQIIENYLETELQKAIDHKKFSLEELEELKKQGLTLNQILEKHKTSGIQKAIDQFVKSRKSQKQAPLDIPRY